MKRAVIYVEIIFTALIFSILFFYVYQQTSNFYATVASYQKLVSCLNMKREIQCKEIVLLYKDFVTAANCTNCIIFKKNSTNIAITQITDYNLISTLKIYTEDGTLYDISLEGNDSYILPAKDIFIGKIVSALQVYTKNESYGCPTYFYGDLELSYDFDKREVILNQILSC